MDRQRVYSQKKAVFGVFRRKLEVKAAKRELLALGFNSSEIEIMFPPHRGPQDFQQRQRSLVQVGALIGAGVGGLAFMAFGIVTSLKFMSDTHVQHSGIFSNLGLVVLLGLIGFIFIGAISGALVGIGTPERAARRYGDYVDAGGILMSVHVEGDEQTKQVKNILDRFDAQDINLLKEDESWKTVYSKLFDQAHHLPSA